MSKTVQLKGGTTTANNNYTGSSREVTVDTTKNTLIVHDGSTVGGHALATESYADNLLSNLIDSAPSTLDTLNELSAALGDDPNFATTITNLIGEKLNSSAYTADDVLTKIKTVDGSGSGLDADTLDSYDSSQFIRSDTDDTVIGTLSFLKDSGELLRLGKTDTNNDVYVSIGHSGYGWMLKYVGSTSGTTGNELRFESNTGKYIQLDHDGNFEYYDGSNIYKIWTQANDGSGSGLDADTLDGQHGSYYSHSISGSKSSATT
jgi:hypothetical protein